MPNLCIIPSLALEKHQAGEITATDIVVLCAIGHHTDGKTGEGCWASVRSMCEKSGIPRSTFFRAANKLLEAGLITRVSGQFDGTTSTYAISMGGVPPVRLPSPAAETPVSHQLHSPTINAPFNASSSSGLVPSEYEPDLEMLLKRIGETPNASISAWIAEIRVATQGMHGKPITPEQCGEAIRAFNANGAPTNFKLFKT